MIIIAFVSCSVNMLTNLDALVFAKFFTLVISFMMDLNFSSALLQKH